MTAISTKGYELIAKVVNDFAYTSQGFYESTAHIAGYLAEAFVPVLQADNPRFDADLFRAACKTKPKPRWWLVPEARFDEMLGILPPIGQCGYGFLVGEALDHRGDGGRPRFAPFVSYNGKFYEGRGGMTVQDWKAFNPTEGIVAPYVSEKRED